jgi:hypothetical protein
MPIDSTHPEYEAYQWQWRKCRACVEGEEAVKAGGTYYLPMLGGVGTDDYLSYKARASFYAAASRTVKGLAGAVLSRPYDISYPGVKTQEDFSKDNPLSNIGASNEPLSEIVRVCLEEVLTVGRIGVLVDAEGDGQPYLSLYYAEHVANWREDVFRGRRRLSMLVLKEDGYEVDPNDSFVLLPVSRRRVFALDADGLLTVELFENSTLRSGNRSDGWAQVGGTILPRITGGNRLNFIPFVFINGGSTNPKPEKSPILDLVNVNLGHYRNSADYEHGLHFTALPTPWAAGWDDGPNGNSPDLRIGSLTAWTTNNPQAHAGMLEFSGAGLASIRDALDRKERHMAALGARLLEDRKSDAESAKTTQLRKESEKSALSIVADQVSEGLTRALRWHAEWSRKPVDGVGIGLYTDFGAQGMDAVTLEKLFLVLQGKGISYPTFHYILNRAGMYPDGTTLQKELDAIAAGSPVPDVSVSKDEEGDQGRSTNENKE